MGRGNVGLALVHDYLAVILQLLERSADVIRWNCQFLRGAMRARSSLWTFKLSRARPFQGNLGSSLIPPEGTAIGLLGSAACGLAMGAVCLGSGVGSSGKRSFICWEAIMLDSSRTFFASSLEV